ncbi:MAG: sulfatase-like hydrolase/transferase [Planctomycetota bacterium]
MTKLPKRIDGLIGALAACVLLAALPHEGAAQSNVVVIVSDDAGWADYGFMRSADAAADPGNRGSVPTPNLDALAAMGVTFTNAYTGSVCSPSRAMITTGQYGSRFGYSSNIVSDSSPINTAAHPQGLPTSSVTVWEHMQGAGYDTAAVGKWHIGSHGNGGGQLGNRPENQGVEFFQGLWGGSRDYNVGGVSGDGELRETFSDGAGGISSTISIENNYSGQYVTDVFGDQSADYIRSKAGGSDPFFLYSSFTAPHTPLQATAADLAFIDSLNEPAFTGNRRTYAAMQYAMDRNVGKILDAIADPAGDGTGPGNDADSLADDTLVIFLNDNGGDCCDVGPNASDNGDLRNGKGSQFEGGMRVPMIVAGAGVNAAQHGTVSADLVHSVDIVPTALVGAGGGSFGGSAVIDGVNLLPYINGTQPGVAHESLFISRYNNQQSAVRFGKWKFMYQNGTGYQLYDLDNDIDESNNVVNAPANEAVLQQGRQLLASYHVQMDKPRFDNQADETNQFDHFRFREEASANALFSTANAWTNGDTNAGSFTASWRDGYANNELTFRAKAGGDYAVSNDLAAVGGLAYMANKINLISSSGTLNPGHTGTVNGLPLMMTKSLAGAAPQINLDASDAAPKAFTFKIDADIEVYDDLTIQGDGNQNFEINGEVREFRPGRSVTKAGSSDLTLGGGVDISGAFSVQSGSLALTNGQFRGDLVAHAGSGIVVGGAGFNEVSGAPTPSPIVTDGLTLNFDAVLDTPGDAAWVDAASGQSLTFAGPAPASAVNNPVFPAITAAYDIAVTGGAEGLAGNYFENNGPRSVQDATFEVWFHVSDTNAGNDQILFEAGGAGRGVSFQLDGDTLSFDVNGDASATSSITQQLGVGWHQAVGVIDLVGNRDDLANDSMSLFVDNTLVGTLNNLLIDDWAGGNNSGIGDVASSPGAGAANPIPYHGEIGIVRYYQNEAFGLSEVNQNFLAAMVDPVGGSTGPTHLAIEGDYTQHDAATLEIDLLDTTDFDAVNVTGAAVVDGVLQVGEVAGFAPAVGDVFTVLTADGGLSGEFDAVNLPVMPGLHWQVEYSANAVTLSVIFGADFDNDGDVDLGDLLILQRGFGLTGQSDNTNGDADGSGVVDGGDLAIWRDAFSDNTTVNAVLGVPEPSAAAGLSCGVIVLGCTCRWFSCFRSTPAFLPTQLGPPRGR